VTALEAQRARLQADAALAQAEGAYLAAEQRLVLSQVRRLSLMLASRASAESVADSGASWGGDSAARDEAKEAQAAAAVAWALLPAASGLRALGGLPERLREVRGLAREVARLLAAQQREAQEHERRAHEAERRLEASKGRCRQLLAQLREVADKAGVCTARAEARVAEAARARDAAQEQEAQLRLRLDALVRPWGLCTTRQPRGAAALALPPPPVALRSPGPIPHPIGCAGVRPRSS
jgi:hypothetical protein